MQWYVDHTHSSSILFHTGSIMPGAGSCELKCISDGFHRGEQIERAGFEETHSKQMCFPYSHEAGVFPPPMECVCLPSVWEVSCNLIYSACPEDSYLQSRSPLHPSNTMLLEAFTNDHLGSSCVLLTAVVIQSRHCS